MIRSSSPNTHAGFTSRSSTIQKRVGLCSLLHCSFSKEMGMFLNWLLTVYTSIADHLPSLEFSRWSSSNRETKRWISVYLRAISISETKISRTNSWMGTKICGNRVKDISVDGPISSFSLQATLCLAHKLIGHGGLIDCSTSIRLTSKG